MQSSTRRKRSKLYLIAAVVVVAAIGAWLFYRNGQKKVDDQPLLVKVEKGSIENTIASSGTLKPLSFVDVGAQVSGQLQKMYVQVGDVVKEGQLLAEIDAKLQESKVESSRAGIAALVVQIDGRKAALELAKSTAARQERLRSANATSQLEYDTAVNNLASAQSALEQLQKQIEQSQASLNSDETTLNYTKIYAPVAGTVVSISLIEGNTLNAVQMAPTILRISNLSTMTVQAEISEADISNIKPGMDVYFTTLGGGDRRWYSKVRQILPTPTVTNNVVLYTGLFDVDNVDAALLSEMTAQVYFITAAAQNVLTVPIGALKFGNARIAAAGGTGNAGAAAAGAQPAAPGQAAGAGGPPGGFRPGGGAGGPPAGFTPGQGRPPGFAGGNGQGRRGGFGGAPVDPNAPRAATATVFKADGTREERQVMVGVSSRVSAEVISGLTAGEQVIAGVIQANPANGTNNQQNQQNNNRGGFPGGGFPGGGFPGGRF